MKKRESELNYDLKLTYKSEWYKYFGEYEYSVNLIFKSILGDYQKIKPEVLAEGIQKIHDLDALKKYQIELIKLQDYLEKQKSTSDRIAQLKQSN